MRPRLKPIVVILVMASLLIGGPVRAAESPLRSSSLPGPLSVSVGDAATFAVQGCFSDPEADTIRQDLANPIQVVEVVPAADLVEFCLDYTPQGLAVSATIPEGTDPSVDPAWDNFGAAISFSYTDTEGDPREIQLSTQRTENVFEAIVLRGVGESEAVCAVGASFSDGIYSASVPADCLDGPATLEMTVRVLYDRNAESDQIVDGAPGRGGFISVPLLAPSGADQVERFQGPSRVETAIATSQASFPGGDADAVLIALADNFPDALVAAPLAVARNAPVLLSFAGRVPQAIRDEALRAMDGPGDVVLLGGTAALRDVVAQTFESDGHQVTRVAGSNRFSTSVAVAQATNPHLG